MQLFVCVLFLRFALRTQHKAVGASALPPRYDVPAVAGALLPYEPQKRTSAAPMGRSLGQIVILKTVSNFEKKEAAVYILDPPVERHHSKLC